MYKKAIFFYLCMMTAGTFMHSCCETIFTVTADFTVYFEERGTGLIFTSQDTIRGPFSYGMSADVISYIDEQLDLGLIQMAYATSCNEVYKNAFRSETASLVLDKPIVLAGQSLPAGTNLLDIAEIGDNDYSAFILPHTIAVWFDEDVLIQSSFPLSTYTFTVSVQLEDGTVLQSSDSIVVDIN